ncbi:MAG: peptide deformylase [Alphaproteobacteria bacterium]|jgi:peptide deformylase
MAILKIARMGHPVLMQRAHEVPDPTELAVARLVDAMIETMEDADGTGLAAPQVHVPWRVVVYKVERGRAAEEDGDEDGDVAGAAGVPTTAMINPVLEPLGEDTDVGFEACLSVPGMAGPVRRFTRIRYRYQTLTGDTVEGEAHGFHARVLQHECDHLDGVLYPMRIEDMRQFGFVEELQKGAGDDGDEDEGDAA